MKADIYSRKSSADGGKSVAQQDDDCTEGIADHGWEVGRRFTDDNRSASRYASKRREDYEALVEYIAGGGCEILAMWETARGGRREVTYFELLELCRARGTKIYIFTHDRLYDLHRRSDWRSLAQEVIDSADLSGKISEGSQRGKRKIAMAGKPAGRLLYGYIREYDPHTGEYLRQLEHPQQGPVVRQMADAVLAGKPSLEIARTLNIAGITTARGVQWRGRDIGRLLINPAYVRKRVHRGEALPDVEADWPALLELDVWRQCRVILSDPARRTQRGTDLKWVLSGVVECGYGCEGTLRPHQGNHARKYACWSCWRVAVSGDDLDEYVTVAALDRLGLPDAADLFQPRAKTGTARRAERAAAQLRDELAEWRALAKARKVSPASFADIEAALLPKLAEAEEAARLLSAPPPLPELVGVDVVDRWDQLSVGTRRDVIRMLMRITLLPSPKRGGRFTSDRVQIVWRG